METLSAYFSRLKKLGIKELGSGCYSTVFTHPDSRFAVKFVQNDTEYIRYAKKAMKNPDNPWLPRIFSIHNVHVLDGYYQDERSTYQIVFMERLKRAPIKIIRAKVKELCRLCDIDGVRSFDEFSDDEWEDIMKETDDVYLKKAIKILLTIDSGDLHDENVMLRDDGQLVFTDPVAT